MTDSLRGTAAIRVRAITLVVLTLGLLVGLTSGVRAAEPGSVLVVAATGEVDGVMADRIECALAGGAAGGAVAVVIRLDTPGGSLEATRRIVGSLLGTPVPTIVWVAPAGGFAASAGTFITLAANRAYMAPGTRIGAASPIDSSGNDIPGTLGDKIRNDTAAWARSIAQERGRPADWAAATVTEARSSSAVDAAGLGVIDGIAATLPEVLAASDGATVKVAGANVVLALAGAPIVEAAANPFDGILGLLADPNVAFLLFTAGILALAFEAQAPNLLTGVLGLVAIALASIGFINLPTDLTGLLLVAIGLVLLALEPAIPSHGILTLVGVAAFVLGGSALYTQADQFGPSVRVAVPLLAIATVTAAALGGLITITAIRTRRMTDPRDGQPGAVEIGTIAEVRRPLEPLGSIYAVGEEWSARASDARAIPRGAVVRVIGAEGLIAIVEPVASG
jgi:membrane-bound serine protease (ClpP class)